MGSTGVIRRGGETWGPREDSQTLNEERKNTSIHVHTGTWYLELRMLLGTACVFERKHSAARDSTHRKARHGTVRHCTALRCAAEL